MSGDGSLEARFDRACGILLDSLEAGEALSLEFSGEDSIFLRFNAGKVRQIGSVVNSAVRFRLYREGRTLTYWASLGGKPEEDSVRLRAALARARADSALLPVDSFQTLPSASDTSREEYPGSLPDPYRLPDLVLAPADRLAAANAEFVGIHIQGEVCRGSASTAGARHWFATRTFGTDWSAFLPNGKALKSCYAGRRWDAEEWERRLAAEEIRLAALDKPEKVLSPGRYRAYLDPEALAEFLVFFSWYGLSERSLREGESAWASLQDGVRSLSGKFSLSQDFTLGVQPRFNELGETAPAVLPLVEGGRLVNTLISAKSALLFGAVSNAAPDSENLRSPVIAAGDLQEENILAALGTGLYIPNLHYLNWSDYDSARVTGMTRFACLWVENGRPVCPIRDMRFDESLYNLWGSELEAVTRNRNLVAETHTYNERALGGALLPGMLVRSLTLTL
ncbi:MAG TPA: metallopeptidase TldD-related protein [Magnetospirillaceae bacterium]|nr:metallopeptidase TldD-related protein [Magnetospirillaceae bacterium]